MDNAELQYRRLLKDGRDELDRLIAENAAEHHFLDFKEVPLSGGSNSLNESISEKLGKALSGFSNSQGGIIVWGIRKKDRDRAPMGYSLVKKPKQLVEALNRRISEIIVPTVDGVDSRVIFENAQEEGVVATYIPASEKTPHMYLIKKSYYKRSGDSFLKMEHYDLEDMFGRRSRPKLALKIALKSIGTNGTGEQRYDLALNLINEGKAMTQHYGLDIELPIPLKSISRSGVTGRGIISSLDDESNFTSIKLRKTDSPFFPTEQVVLAPNNHHLGHIYLELSDGHLNSLRNLPVRYKIYSENMNTKEGEYLFEELLSNDK